MASGVQVSGLRQLVTALKGPAFRDVNRELRGESKRIAQEMVPLVSAAVARSAAPQARAMAATVRVHPDRVPVVAVGKVNPRFKSGFTRRGSDSKRRRGSLAAGVVIGPLGGRRDTKTHENYYRIGRNNSWGPLGAAVRGPILDTMEVEYLKAYIKVLTAHGFNADT